MIEKWVDELCRELSVPRDAVDIDAVLELAKDAAHSVERPAAPVTAYLVGYAAGARGGGTATVDELVRRAGRLARDWDTEPPPR